MDCAVHARLRPTDKRAGQSGEVQHSGNTVTVKSRKPGGGVIDERLGFDRVYGPNASNSEVYERSAAPLVKAAVQGTNSSLFLFGPTSGGKSYTLDGGSKGDPSLGLVGKTFQGLFSELEKQTAGRGLDVKVKVQFAFFANECIYDCLGGGRDLVVEQDESSGPVIKGLKASWVTSVNEACNLYRKARSARDLLESESDSVFSSGIVFVTIYQAQTSGAEKTVQSLIKSTLTIVDSPGSESLGQDEVSLKQREGHTKTQSILSLGKVLRRLASSQDSDYADFQTSFLGMLYDVLGGNCMTTFLVTLNPSMAGNVAVTLEYAKLLKKIKNYPIKVNDDKVLGLLRRFRIQAMKAKSIATDAPRMWHGEDGGHDTDQKHGMARKLQGMEGQAIKDNIEKLKYKEEKELVYDKLVECRERYTAQVKAKADVQAELIRCEEEKLKISKALIDLQIENNILKDKTDSTRFEMENRLLSEEHDMVELRTKYNHREKKAEELEQHVEELLEDKRDIMLELVALKSNLDGLKDEYNLLTEENDDIKLELVNLDNTKRGLQKNNNNLEKDLLELRSMINSSEELKEELSRRVAEGEEFSDDLRKRLLESELDVTKKSAAIESEKIEMERNLLIQQKAKDSENLELRERLLNFETDEMRRVEQLNSAETELKLAKRTSERAVEDLEAKSKDEEELRDAYEKLKSKHETEAEAHRQRLLKYMDEIQDLVMIVNKKGAEEVREINPDEPGGEVSRPASATSVSDLPTPRDMFKQILGEVDKIKDEVYASFKEKEKEDDATRQEAESRARDLSKHNRALIQGHRALIYELEDLLPDEELAAKGFSRDQLRQLEESLESEEQKELQDAKERARLLEKKITAEKKNAVTEAEKHKGILLEMQARYQQAIDKLKKKSGGGGALSKDVAQKISEMAQGDPEVLRQLEAIREQIDSSKGGGGGGESVDAGKVKELQGKIRDLTRIKMKHDSMMDKWQELERGHADLEMQAKVSNEQLKRMEEYMKKSTVKYQKEIVKMRRQIEELGGTYQPSAGLG